MSTDLSSPDRPRARSRRPPTWVVLFLAGPVIWYLHFWVVYLAAEAVCSGAGSAQEVAGAGWLSAFVIVTTAGAVALIAGLAVAARRVDSRSGHRSELARSGAALGFVFAVATLFVGLPAIVLPPC